VARSHTADEKALACARRIGDLLCDKFLAPEKHMLDIGSSEMNHAPIHSSPLLYRKTGEKRYLDLAQEIVEEFALPGAGDYFRVGLAGKAFYQSPSRAGNRCIPSWAGRVVPHHRQPTITAALSSNSGGASPSNDRHNNGRFPPPASRPRAILSRRRHRNLLHHRLDGHERRNASHTGNSLVADELELSTLNQVLALHSRDGKWCTYNTPMDGLRKPSTIDHRFQKRPGSEQLNCCSVNAARGFGLLFPCFCIKREQQPKTLAGVDATAVDAAHCRDASGRRVDVVGVCAAVHRRVVRCTTCHRGVECQDLIQCGKFQFVATRLLPVVRSISTLMAIQAMVQQVRWRRRDRGFPGLLAGEKPAVVVAIVLGDAPQSARKAAVIVVAVMRTTRPGHDGMQRFQRGLGL